MLQDVTQKSFDPESLIVGMDEKEIKQLVLKIFNYQCPVCSMPGSLYLDKGTAGTVHEIIPRSRGKKSLTFRNRIPLCNNHHDLEHHFGASPERIKALQRCRSVYLIMIGKSEYV